MTLPRGIRIALKLLTGALLLLALLAGSLWWYFHPSHTRQNGILYGMRHDYPLTMNVVRPVSPNGLGVLFLVSGGWKKFIEAKPGLPLTLTIAVVNGARTSLAATLLLLVPVVN